MKEGQGYPYWWRDMMMMMINTWEIEIWCHQPRGDERKNYEKIFQKNQKVTRAKLYSRNFIKGKDIRAVSVERYSGPFLKWTREELKQTNQRTRKLMTIHKMTLTKYVLSKEGERGLASIEKCWRINITTWEVDKKVWWKSDYSQQK